MLTASNSLVAAVPGAVPAPGVVGLEVSPSWEASAVRFVPVEEAEAIEEPRQ